ncbi:hypothetical protein E0Z10_g4167 [Xylaria hypoxylon]|uniref:SRR1-like domain-containing protein n=1 Tax=Xylaria hypoxylon TaxID=37992 RepID=A0A4Z0YXC3_9PEZI|nr:hypothetical protein E0Z10_g4167 [Xylaria hypoxylon]
MPPDTDSKAKTKAKMESSEDVYEDVYKALENARAEWATSKDARGLNARLTDAVEKKKLVGVRNIVCFGLAGPECWGVGKPLTDDAKLKGHGNRSLIQHVAALFMADVITEASENKEKVEVYSQDPMYRSHDIKALKAHGIQVLGGHEGFVKVGADTLVFLMGAGTPILRVLCETTRPAAIICTLLHQNQDIDGAHALLKLLDLEYDECMDWLPFFHPLIHTRVAHGRPQTMADLAQNGQRPLQGASVRFLKPRFSIG